MHSKIIFFMAVIISLFAHFSMMPLDLTKLSPKPEKKIITLKLNKLGEKDSTYNNEIFQTPPKVDPNAKTLIKQKLQELNQLGLSPVDQEFKAKKESSTKMGQRKAIITQDSAKKQDKGVYLSESIEIVEREIPQQQAFAEIVIPKGLEFDELNSADQIMLAFKRRVFMTYLNTILSKYYEYLRRDPSKSFMNTNKREILEGKVTFDEDGNIVRIKILRWADHEKLQEFFVDSLKGIRAIKNPPEFLVSENEFSIRFGLIVN